MFAELIDHPRHAGYMYDIYGELLILHISQVFVRPRDSKHNAWHPDGARAVPFGAYAPELPLQVKIGYWLTDLPHPKMGNFVYMPGSHGPSTSSSTPRTRACQARKRCSSARGP